MGKLVELTRLMIGFMGIGINSLWLEGFINQLINRRHHIVKTWNILGQGTQSNRKIGGCCVFFL